MMLGDNKEHSLQEADDKLSEQFKLTDEERSELLPSGQQPVFRNRLGWARTYMKKAGLLTTPSRAKFIITDRGLSLLKENPKDISAQFLTRYQEFVDFKSVKKPKDNGGDFNTTEINDSQTDKTPEEALEYAYQKLRSELAKEVLDVVKNCSPWIFRENGNRLNCQNGVWRLKKRCR